MKLWSGSNRCVRNVLSIGDGRFAALRCYVLISACMTVLWLVWVKIKVKNYEMYYIPFIRWLHDDSSNYYLCINKLYDCYKNFTDLWNIKNYQGHPKFWRLNQILARLPRYEIIILIWHCGRKSVAPESDVEKWSYLQGLIMAFGATNLHCRKQWIYVSFKMCISKCVLTVVL